MEYSYALHVLDQQLAHTISRRHDHAQAAYYDGMKTMFNILLSNGYVKNIFVTYDDNGKHYIVNREE